MPASPRRSRRLGSGPTDGRRGKFGRRCAPGGVRGASGHHGRAAATRPGQNGPAGQRHAWSSFSWGASRTGECPQNVMPDVPKNHREEVNQTAVSALNSTPPEHRNAPAGRVGAGQHQHLGREHAVDEAAGQRVREHPRRPQLEAQRVEAVHGHRDGEQHRGPTGPAVQPGAASGARCGTWPPRTAAGPATSANAAEPSQALAAVPLEKPATDSAGERGLVQPAVDPEPDADQDAHRDRDQQRPDPGRRGRADQLLL